LQGGDKTIVAALGRGDVEGAPVTEKERVLLRFVELITRHAWRTTAGDVQKLRDVDWTDDQIAEAVYIAALFAFFNRVADAFGLEDPQYGQMSGNASPDPPGCGHDGAEAD
jgi:alkylhydroperoxidase family enzyme